MKKIIYPALFAVLLMLPACAFHFPFEWEDDYSYGDYSIVLRVTPDDAHVLLNGQFIGEAYEFSTRASAIRLRSARNELVIKKEGYLEELVDVGKYNMKKITVELTMRPDRVLRKETVVRGETPPPPPPDKTVPEKEYKVVKEKEVPKEEEVSPSAMDFSPVVMTVTPPEASIYVDGVFWGVAPEGGLITNFNLNTGKHTIDVVKPGFTSVTQNITVTGKKEIKVIIKLEKK